MIADGLKVNGINRYIMECKWKSMNGMGQSGRELIDTLWNVNSMLFRPDLYVTPELIDTLWNVNY